VELLSVSQAASILDVHDSRVRQLLVDGGLLGQRVGGRWLVDGNSVFDRKEQGPSAGRSLSPRNAWGALALLGGYPPAWLSAPEKSRLRARLRNLAAHRQLSGAHLQRLLAARAGVWRYRVHPGLLLVLVSDREVVMGGVSAAAAVGADYLAPNRAEVYVRPDKSENLVAEFGMALDPQRGNLLIRVPPIEAWPFLASAPSLEQRGQYAPAAVVAADLLDIREDRAQSAAAGLLGSLSPDFMRNQEKP
jgi:excisionase family DNA binding protein